MFPFLHIAIFISLLSLPLPLVLIRHWPLTGFSFWPLTYFSSLSILPSIPPPLTQISFRCFKSIRYSKFSCDILHSRLITHPPPKLSDLVDAYNSTLTFPIDIHAPLKTKTFRAKPINKWYTPVLSTLKAARRHLENLWLRTRSPHHIKLLRTASNIYHSANIAAKKR